MTKTNQTQVAVQAASKVNDIAAQARTKFIGRDQAINALAAAIVAGEHAILLGPPGTAKSDMVRFFADAMDRDFFRRVLNPDTTREDLVGPIDPSGLKETPARWDRAWAGLATTDIALLDEVGKASNQVLNMLLDAMEERRVTSGNVDRNIPLHIAIGASNETLNDDVEAIWDRFTVRIVVGYLGTAGDFVRLLTDSHVPAKKVELTRDELAAMRAEAKAMAASPSTDVVETMVKLWSRIGNQTQDRVSDRRWKKLLVVAAGRALLMGRTTIQSEDLIVGGDILWTRVDDIATIAKFVASTVDEEGAEIGAKKILVNELVESAKVATELSVKAQINYRASKLMKEIQGRSGRAEWDVLRATLKAVQETVMDE
jgi:MoxR-like ATPase